VATEKIPSRQKILTHFDRRDPVIAELVREMGPFQLSVKAAESITARFWHLFDGHAPNPQKVWEMPESTLRGAGLSRQKVAYMKDLGKHFAEKLIRPHRLAYLSNEEVIEQLTDVYGIGPWTAEMFLIFSLNRMDVLPVTDLGLQIAIQKLYGMKSRPTVKKIRSLGKKWHPMETVATWYGWRKLDENIVAY
jgi:DNA-3-methyladenine glycosylase II